MLSFSSCASHSEVPGTQHQLLQGFTQLLAAVGVDERVDERVTNDQDEEEVKVSEETVAQRVVGAGEDEDEVEEERTPAYDKNPEQNGEGNRSLHARGLASVFMNSNDVL